MTAFYLFLDFFPFSFFSALSRHIPSPGCGPDKKMEFFQEPTLSALLGLVTLYVVTKIVSLVVSSSIPGHNKEGIAEEIVSRKGLSEIGAIVENNSEKVFEFGQKVYVCCVEDQGYERAENLDVEVEEKTTTAGEQNDEVDDSGNDENCTDRKPETEELSCAEIAENKGLPEEGEDDDWEDIERSALEKAFVEVVQKATKMEKLISTDIEMELYGLHKIAVEGPCNEPQPMPFKLSSRAKWNAWQKLGNLSQEEAMEQYIRILSSTASGSTCDYRAADDAQDSGSGDLKLEEEKRGTLLV